MISITIATQGLIEMSTSPAITIASQGLLQDAVEVEPPVPGVGSPQNNAKMLHVGKMIAR